MRNLLITVSFVWILASLGLEPAALLAGALLLGVSATAALEPDAATRGRRLSAPSVRRP